MAGITPRGKGTRARKLLVHNALRYLDTLAIEAKEDRSLQRDLANAYLKLADVQGNPLHSNLGDTAGSIANYKKVVSMREALVAADPKNQDDRFQLAVAYRWLGQMQVACWRSACWTRPVPGRSPSWRSSARTSPTT